MLDELRRLQVFYVNVGGGEPMIRRDFFQLVEYAVDHGIGVKFSTNGTYLDAAAARRLAAMDYLDVQISLDGVDAATNDARARCRLVRRRPAGDGPPRRRRLRAVQDLGRRHPPQRRPARRLQGARRLVRRPAAGHPAAPVGTRRRLVARAAPDERPAAADLPLAARSRRRRADRRLLLPPQRARRAAARAEHVRGGAGGLPDRPDRRRVRLPVRHPRRVPRRVGARRRRVHRDLARRASCSASCASPQSAGACASCGSYDACQGGCMAAKFFTGLPLDGPDPECVTATARRSSPASAPAWRRSPARRWTTPAPSASSAADPVEYVMPGCGAPRTRQRLSRRMRLLEPLALGAAHGAQPDRCSGPTSPTSATTTAASRVATSPTTSGGPAAAAARSSSRAPASTTPTGRTSGHRWPRAPNPAGRRSSPPAVPTARSCWPSLDHAGGQGSSAYSQAPLWAPSRVPEVAHARGAEVDGGRRHRGRRRRVRRGGHRRPRPRAATASRSTPASTASSASSCPG